MYIMVDVEADGPIPGDYSMISFGAVVVERGLNRTFYGELRPISDKWVPQALAVSGFSREKTEGFPSPHYVMTQFDEWVRQVDRPRMIADNNGFDWQFINYYFHHFLGQNPFGYSSANLNSMYHGLRKNTKESFKHLRKTKHTHNPVDDAKGNAEALISLADMGIKNILV